MPVFGRQEETLLFQAARASRHAYLWGRECNRASARRSVGQPAIDESNGTGVDMIAD